MDNKEKILKAEELLKVNKQENVLNFFKKLSEDKQIKLAEKIINLNFLGNIKEDEFIVEDNNIVKNETGNEEADFSSGAFPYLQETA